VVSLIGRAVSWISSNDSRTVGHEHISVQADGKRSVLNQEGSNGLLLSFNSSPVVDVGTEGVDGLASIVVSIVGVSGFSSKELVVNDILIGQPWESTVTSSVAELRVRCQAGVGAINNPLFRERNQSVLGVVDLPLTFNVSTGGECPARTALTLIFNFANSSFGSPVISRREVLCLDILLRDVVWEDASISWVEGLHQVGAFEFIVRKIGELVDSVGGKRGFLVQLVIFF